MRIGRCKSVMVDLVVGCAAFDGTDRVDVVNHSPLRCKLGREEAECSGVYRCTQIYSVASLP